MGQFVKFSHCTVIAVALAWPVLEVWLGQEGHAGIDVGHPRMPQFEVGSEFMVRP